MALKRADAGFKFCPHCDGKTICDCATCGMKTAGRYGGRWMEAGMCKVCQGQGQVVGPNYQTRR